MAQSTAPTSYRQGHSESTIATHLRRTAEIEAAFLLAHIKKTDKILDVGCGPGTITTGFVRYASEGAVIGIDISTSVIEKARNLAKEATVPTAGPGSVTFEEGNILQPLRFTDNTFDVVFASQVFGHFPPPEMPLRALAEIRRILKPNGILATRDGAGTFFFPKSIGLDRLWTENLQRAISKGKPNPDPTGTQMLSLFRRAGFEADGGKVRLGFGTGVDAEPEARAFLARRAAGQLKDGDPFYQSWLDAGITKDEIQETVEAAQKWADTEDAYMVTLQCEMLAWN